MREIRATKCNKQRLLLTDDPVFDETRDDFSILILSSSLILQHSFFETISLKKEVMAHHTLHVKNWPSKNTIIQKNYM